MSSSPAPYKVLKANAGDSSQRSSFWVVAISSFTEPATMYSKGKLKNPVETKQLIVIENDAVQVSVNDTKDSFGKMASISLKSTDIYYPSMVHNGDWLFIWMFDNQQKADQCVLNLKTIQSGKSVGYKLCDYQSGLKFAGRITSVKTTDSVSNQARTISQSIEAQMFLELATSIYYTYDAPAAAGPVAPPSGAAGTGFTGLANARIELYQKNGMDRALQGLAQKFLDFYKSAANQEQFSPDNIIALYFVLIMGIDSNNAADTQFKGTLNDAIQIPADVARIMNINSKRLWSLYDLQLGVQRFQPNNPWWKSFAPVTSETGKDKITHKSAARCKGFVPFTPVMWDNVSMWSILENYVNPICNEMYTALKLDKNGNLRHTLTVREKPFTTGLFNAFTPEGKTSQDITAKPSGVVPEKTTVNKLAAAIEATTDDTAPPELKPSVTFGPSATAAAFLAGPLGEKAKEKTDYATVPRWIIDDSIVHSFSWGTNEGNRINFVQCFGRASASEFTMPESATGGQDKLKQSQFLAGNFVADEADISRNGLRASIQTSTFDIFTGTTASGSMAPIWARMNADWLFNGHLKAHGSITMDGIWEPIAVGDNLQYNGILFHIEAISHSCSLSGSNKVWTTTISLSNGILASSMTKKGGLPVYPAHSQVDRRANNPGPGITNATTRVMDQKSTKPSDQIKGLTKL